MAVAQILGIPRSTALRGMWNARPDVGVVNIQRTNWKNKEILWIPLFAVNDRESTIIGVDALQPYYDQNATRIGILNNRYDRADRAMRFANIAANDLDFDYWITFGAYESQVTEHMLKQGVPPDRIINLGFSVKPYAGSDLRQNRRLDQGRTGCLDWSGQYPYSASGIIA